jgi:hypothetical protein
VFADAGGHDQPATHQHGAKPQRGKAANHQKTHAGKK